MPETLKDKQEKPVAYAIYSIIGGKSRLAEVKPIPANDTNEEWRRDDGCYGEYWSGNEPLFTPVGLDELDDLMRDAMRYRWLRQCDKGSRQAHVCLAFSYEAMDAAIDDGLKNKP